MLVGVCGLSAMVLETVAVAAEVYKRVVSCGRSGAKRFSQNSRQVLGFSRKACGSKEVPWTHAGASSFMKREPPMY